MPKLSRIHLAGLGHKDAKFQPLGLRFTDARNSPAHTLLWLPNGGGKSLLIAFKYAALRPNKHDFLGRRTGRGADLEDFVSPGKLAVVLLEFDYADMGGARRVMGYAAVRREQGLERVFFSFQAHPSLAWEALPVLGLGEPAPNLKKLIEHFRAADQRDRARVAFFETSSQSDWEVHLRDDLKLDPEIFHHHLVMNSDEGGVTKVFAKKTTDEFIQLFLQLALEGESIYRVDERGDRVDQVRQLVTDYKRAFHQNPKRELTRNLCNELLPILKLIHASVERRNELAGQLAKAEADAALFLRSVADRRDSIGKGIAELHREIGNLEAKSRAHKDTKQQMSDWAEGYEMLRKTLYFDETENQLTDAASLHGTLSHRLRLLRAAKAAATANAAAALLRSLEEERRAKLLALEPDLAAIKAIGGKLDWILIDRKRRLDADSASLELEFSNAQEALVVARTLRGTATASLTATRKALQEVVASLNDLRARRQALHKEGLADEGETITSAAKRWKQSVADLTASIEGLTSEQAEWRQREQYAAARESEWKIKSLVTTTERDKFQTKLDDWNAKVKAFSEMPAIQTFGVQGEVSVWNQALPAALQARSQAARGRALDLRITGSDDERTIQRYQPPDRPLFPAPLDVEIVRDLLKSHGIEAGDAYSHLDAAHQQTSDAEAQLRVAPAEWSGLVISTRAAFDRAKQLVRDAPISRPIAILYRDWIASPTPSTSDYRHVVTPKNRGMWNRAMARADIHEVARRKETNAEAIAKADQEDRESGDALSILRQLQQQSRDVVIKWESDVVRLNSDLAHANEAIRLAGEERLAAKQTADDFNPRLNAAKESLKLARTHDERLQKHATKFEDRAEEWNTTQARLSSDEERLVDEHAQAERDVLAAEQGLAPFGERRQQLANRAVALQLERDRLQPAFVGTATEPVSGETAETLWPRFEADVRTYLKSSTDQALNLRIELARNANRDAQTEFKKASKELSPAQWESWMSRDDLPALIESVAGECKTAEDNLNLARRAHEMAAVAWPESQRVHRGREKIDPERPAKFSIDAESLREQCLLAARSAEQQREAVEEQLRQKRDSRADLKELDPKYEAISGRAPEGISMAETGAHRDFVGEIAGDEKVAIRVYQAVKDQRRFQKDADAAAEDLFEKQWKGILVREAFTKSALELREKIAALPRGEIEHDPLKHLRSITGIRDACENEITQLATQRASLVKHLWERASLAAKRLKSLQTESYLPKELDAWGGHPFLRVELSISGDETERARNLGTLVEKWAREGDESDLPAGHVLAFACLKAVLASNGASLKLLKPTQRLELYYHDITELTGFSEGQRVTAAILIYSVLVKLRQKQAGSLDGLPLDAGYLLLDNPPGKANHTALVDLQLRVAKAMGLQLIYASGINDPGALVHFGHIVRLKNTALDPRTGDKLVQLDVRAGELSAVELGVFPRAVAPPRPPMPSPAPRVT